MRSKSVATVIIIVTSIIMCALLAGDIINTSIKVINCKDGVGQIDKYDNNDPFIITGDWEVYKDSLIISENKDISTLNKTYLSSLSQSLKKSDNMYYYSYRTVITGIPKESVLSCNSNSFLKGYAVYFNGELVRTDNHLVDRDGNPIHNGEKLDSYYFDGDELEIVVELSNKAASYYAFVNDFYLDGISGHFSLISFQALYLIGIIVCSLLFLYFLLSFFSRRKPVRSTLFVIINLASIAAIIFNGKTTFFRIPPIPGTVEKMVRLFCYYVATIIFMILARTDICTKKLAVADFFLAGSIGLAIIVGLIMPIQFINYTYGVVCLLAAGLLVYSLVTYIKRSEKDTAIQVSIVFYLVESILCFIYEILTITPLFKYSTSSLSTLLFLSCVMLTVLNAYLREKEAEKSSLTKELTDKIRDTEFTFLNSQIQSHFIYNTLNSIQSLCNTNPEKASELVEEFSFYLRNRLEFNKMPNLINLEDEIEHIKTYINIEQTRFGDNIKCIYDLGVTDIKIPPLSVQPLVENAVKHGVSKQVGGGTIILSTYQDKNNVYIRVKDNGLGFDVEKLKNSKRVGFNNIKDRLSLYLNATIKLDSKIGVGTVVTITIPKKSLTYDNTSVTPPDKQKK